MRRLHGDRADRINTNEPRPAASRRMTPPKWLSRDGRAVWRQYAPDLTSKGVLTAWDVEAFAVWCDAVIRRRTAVRHLEDEGEVREMPVFNQHGDQTGYRIAKNPWTLVLNEADSQVQRYGARFGMTPSDRAQIKVGGSAGDPNADLLSG